MKISSCPQFPLPTIIFGFVLAGLSWLLSASAQTHNSGGSEEGLFTYLVPVAGAVFREPAVGEAYIYGPSAWAVHQSDLEELSIQDVDDLFKPIEASSERGRLILEWRSRHGYALGQVSAQNIGGFFETIDTPEKALELCQLLHWGTLVESRDEFEKILALYQKLRLDTDSEQKAGDKVFGAVTQSVPGGFEVSFTAYVLGRGMGARVSVARYHYTVETDGKVTQKALDVYLIGPRLNWQTMELNAEQGAANQRDYERRKELIEGVYTICPSLIPGRIHARARQSR